MSEFKKIEIEDLKENPFKAIGSDWMLITAGTREAFNMMTASWGGFGVLWHKNVCFCVIRPSRHTFRFIENSEYFTFTFFNDSYRNMLNMLGSKSGRDIDKIKESSLTPVEDETGTVYFKEARLVIVLKKIYYQDLEPGNFLDPEIEFNYPEKDYHRMYVGEVVRILGKQ